MNNVLVQVSGAVGAESGIKRDLAQANGRREHLTIAIFCGNDQNQYGNMLDKLQHDFLQVVMDTQRPAPSATPLL